MINSQPSLSETSSDSKLTTTLGDSFGAELRRVVLHSDNHSRIALLDDKGVVVSFGELADRINMTDPAAAGELVLLCLGNEINSLMTYVKYVTNGYSLLMVPISQELVQWQNWIANYQPERIAMSSIAAAPDIIAFLTASGYVTVRGDHSETLEFQSRHIASGHWHHDQLLLLTTSGSTGSAKTAQLGMSGVLCNVNDIIYGLNIAPEDRALLSLPLFYTYGLSILNSHLLAGASVFVTRANFLQRNFVDHLSEAQVSAVSGVPSTYEAMLRLGFFESSSASIRRFDQAGGKLQPAIVRKIAFATKKCSQTFQPMYGQTEATARIAIMPSHLVEAFPEFVGEAIRSSKVSLGSNADSNEIVVTSPSVMRGYAACRSDLEKSDELKGLLATGDLGHIENGLIRIVGRLKRIVKYRGIRMSLDDIEARLRDMFSDRNIAVVAQDEKVRVYVERAGSLALSVVDQHRVQGIVKGIGISDADYRVIELDAMPLLENGKIDYRALSHGAAS